MRTDWPSDRLTTAGACVLSTSTPLLAHSGELPEYFTYRNCTNRTAMHHDSALGLPELLLHIFSFLAVIPGPERGWLHCFSCLGANLSPLL